MFSGFHITFDQVILTTKETSGQAYMDGLCFQLEIRWKKYGLIVGRKNLQVTVVVAIRDNQ